MILSWMSNYKTAQNFATVTHANTMLGQFNITNAASARSLYVLFIKKKFSLIPDAGKQLWRKSVNTPVPWSFWNFNPHTHTLTRERTHALHKHAKACVHSHVHTHTIFRAVADPKPALKFLFYIFLCIILKNTGYSAKIISLPSFIYFPPSFSLLASLSTFHDLSLTVSFLIDPK